MNYTVVGKSVTPVDAKEKALGTAEYVSDMRLPGMLYGKILRSPYAHARILEIDTSEAERIPGVKAVITFKDTPQIPFGTQSGGPDDWYIFAKDKVRFVGDEVAAVAAVDEETAEKALRHICLAKASKTSSEPVSEPVWDALAFCPISERPTFKVIKGFPNTSDLSAISENFSPSLTLSR